MLLRLGMHCSDVGFDGASLAELLPAILALEGSRLGVHDLMPLQLALAGEELVAVLAF